MNKNLILALGAILSLVLLSDARAKTIKIPEDSPVVSVSIPSDWEPDTTDEGVECESPDKEATIFFEVTTAKKIDELTKENIDWLKKQKVTVDQKTEKSNEFEAGGMKWSSVAWKGTSEEWGPANIILAYADCGSGKVLMVTYWVTEKGEAKHGKQLTEILDSVKKL
ncbi:MAG: hypothetical protein JO295_00860 [Verrucomicrobia bacterium]|nr:hypothetical protein [Verrucomicrobiota bacterium]